MGLIEEVKQQSNPERLTKVVPTKLLPSDAEQLKAIADEQGMTVSSLGRYFILRGMDQIRAELAELRT